MTELDSTYGYDLERLLEVPHPAPPADFAHFWTGTYEAVRQLPLEIETRPIFSPNPRFKVWEVEFNSLDGFRTGGWISLPADGHFERGVVAGHGYGGRSEAALEIPGPPAAVISPCARGFNRSARAELSNDSWQHVLHGIENRETYIHRGCVAELWSAASVLLELYPQVAGALDYYGGSFGGGLGALMLPWDARFRRAFLDVPSFGNHPLRVQLPCTGSGEAVRRRYESDASVLDVLAYFDAASAASLIAVPVFVAAALSDPAVPPPSQFAVYNALQDEKKLFVRQTGHPTDGEDDKQIFQLLGEWFG